MWRGRSSSTRSIRRRRIRWVCSSTPVDPQDELPSEEIPKLGTPALERSTKIGLKVLAAVLFFCVLSIWLPSPAGMIASVLPIYVGRSLSLLVVSDLGQLRDD